jgi:hypothetical protein
VRVDGVRNKRRVSRCRLHVGPLVATWVGGGRVCGSVSRRRSNSRTWRPLRGSRWDALVRSGESGVRAEAA